MHRLRNIRVFLSSTFLDMQTERDALVKLFRQLEVESRKRFISVTLLDLRWGITDDQKRNGKVISTCFQEINNSRPFFIGLLGDRYGWVPSLEDIEANPDLLERFPDVAEYYKRGMSITEMEMRFGALDSNGPWKALFMKKASLKAESENHSRLIDEISDSPHTILREYDSVETLVECVREEFLKTLDELEEEDKIADSHAGAKRAQELVLLEKTRAHVVIPDNMQRIDRWYSSDESALIVDGVKGCGKSALLAKWIERVNINDNHSHLIYYFVGETNYDDSPSGILRYLANELIEIYGRNVILPHSDNEEIDVYSSCLEEVLELAQEKGDKILFILDGLDHLENKSLDKCLHWLPSLSKNVRLLASTNSDDLTLKVLKETKGFPNFTMEPFNDDILDEIVDTYLGRYAKSLGPMLYVMIEQNRLFHYPGLLRILLDDLIAYGSHELLPSHIYMYAFSTDEKDFFGLIINRAEEYYGKDIIKKILSTIALTKNGISEINLIEVLELDPIEWSQVYCGMMNYFIFNNGKINLRYPLMVEAIFERYLNDDEEFALSITKNRNFPAS